MKFLNNLLLIILIFTIPRISFSSTKKINEAELKYILDEYNKNSKDLSSLVLYISKLDSNKGKQLDEFYKNQNIPLNTKLPKLQIETNHLFFTDGLNQMWTLIPHEDGTLSIVFKNTQKEFNFSMSANEVAMKFNEFLATPKSANILDIMIKNANADDGPGELIGMSASAIYTGVTLSVLGALDSLGKIISDISKIPSGLKETSIRDAANKACDDLKHGKPVKNLDKIKSNLEELKVKVKCVPFWESFMENSCGWFDERLTCLSGKSVEVIDNSRDSVKSKENDAPSATRSPTKSVTK